MYPHYELQQKIFSLIQHGVWYCLKHPSPFELLSQWIMHLLAFCLVCLCGLIFGCEIDNECNSNNMTGQWKQPWMSPILISQCRFVLTLYITSMLLLKHIAQIAPLSFQGSHRTQTQTSEMRWLHASVVTEWSPACLHKQFRETFTEAAKENLKWKTFTTSSILVLQTPFKF